MKLLVVALLATALALLARWLLDPALGNSLPFVTFFIAVAAVAGYAGLHLALLVTVVGGALALWFFVPPRASLLITTIPDGVGMLMYVSVTAAIVGFGQAMRRAQASTKVAEQRIREQKEYLQRTLVSIGDAVITADATGNVTLLNAVAEDLTGWSNEQAAGQPVAEVFRIIDEVTRQTADNPVQSVLESGVPVGLSNHTALLSKDGKERPIADSAAPIRDDNDDIVGVVLVFRDITERRAADKSLAESEGRKAAMLASALDGVVSIDEHGAILEFNPAAERLFGYRRDDVLGKEMAELIIPPSFRERHRRGLERFIETGEERVLNRLVELTAMNSDGHEFPIEISISLIEHGDRPSFVSYVRDISGRKHGELELTRSEERFRALTTATASIVWTTDANGDFASEQSSWSDYTGQTRARYRGRGWLNAVHTDDRAEISRRWKVALEARTAYRSEGRLWHAASRSYRYFEAHAVPLMNEDGSVREWVGLCQDTEKEKQLEGQLQKTVEELFVADKRKDEFLATLAHELRNPLAPIRNVLEVLKQSGADDAVLIDACAIMERQLSQMVRLVDDLLDISRISLGKIELRRERVELGSVIQHAVEAAQPLIDSLDQELVVEQPTAPIHLEADAHRLAQVISNLLNNGAIFGSRGGQVKLTVEREVTEAVIRVKDSGIGIDADKLNSIFELFVQADASLERSTGGLGIGLTLVKKIIDLHGGDVSAYSAGIGQGSEFTVRLPVLASAPELPADELAIDESANDAAGARRILVVDDNHDSADSLASLLSLSGHETHVAYDGIECLQVTETLKPEIFIVDIGMPRLNGYEVARRLRETGWGKNVFLIALTGWGQESDRQRAFDAGFDTHFVKPVEFAVLLKFITQLPAARDND